MMGMFLKPQLTNRLTRQTIVALLLSLAISAVAVVACTEVVLVTVEVEVTREVPVTRQVFATFEVPVTRIVEVTREVGRPSRGSVGIEAAVEACTGIVKLLLTFVESYDPSTGLPEMTVDEVGRGWFPIVANVYDSGDEELIRAINKLITPPPDITAAEAEAITIEIVSICGRFVDW